MNKDINLLYEQYKSLGNPETFDEFVQLKDQAGEDMFFEFMNNYVSDSLKKKENYQETPSSSSGLGENQPTPISAQGNPQITSVPISQDLDLNQAQIEAMQGVQNPASLNLELPQQSVNQNGLLESNGAVNTSSSALEDSFNKFIQEGGQLPLNPTSTRLNVLPRAYENQFKNITESTPQEEVGNIALPKKSRIELATFETNGLQEIPIPNKSISDENGNIFKINNDVVKAYKTPSGQTILQTGVGLIPEEVYLSLKDKEGKQRTPQSKDVYENINGVFVEQDYSEVPIDETIKSYKNYDYISSKDEDGSLLVKIDADTEKNLYLGLQAKGLGQIEFHEDGTPKFKINKDTAYILDSMFLSETNKAISTRNAIRNSAYISSVYEGAELEKNARENFIARYGQANYDKYGVLPPQVMDRLQYEERVQNYVSQGYTEQEAVQYANTYRERELQGVREENNFILNNIFSKLKSEDSQEKQAWITFAKSYPKEFRDFFNEYTEKFGDEAWDNSYLLKRFDNPMRRASIKDEFINYLKTLQVYSQIELKNKEKQAKADVRFGAENKNADLINQGYAKLNNLNMVSKFIQGENTAIATLEDQTKPLFKQAYEKGIENAQLESSANRNEFLGTLELGAKKIGNIPSRIIGNLFQSATSFFTGNSDWSKYVNEDIEFSKNAFELNKNAEELRTEVVTYKDKQGNLYKLRDGNIYKVDKNGYEFYKPELDNNFFKSNLTEVSRDKEWNFTSVTAQGAQLIAEVYLMNRLGTSSGKLMSKPFGSYAVRIAKELGTESRYYNILKSAYKGIRASENASPFGMAAYTFGGMTKRNNDLGYDGLESWFKGMFDSGMMYAANRFFPDARFFKDGDKVQKTAFNLLKNGDKKGALELTKNFFIDASYYAKTSAPDIGYEMFEEMGLERMFQGVSDVVSGAFKQDKKIWEKAIDPNNFVDISPETALLTALSTGTIKGVQNLKTSPLASFEGMTDLEKVILSTNMEGLPDALRFISSDASFAGLQGSKATRRLLEMKTAKKYLDQLPKDNTLTISQTADVITNLQKLENLKKEQEKATSESVKKQYQEQINTVEEAIAKKFEESKNNTIVDEQPQQTTQPEQTQETAQGQTTETNVQPEQGTTTTEQGVSIDLNAKTGDTLYKQVDNTNQQNTQTNETKQATEQKQSNVGNTQTPEIIGNQTDETAISEEEQEKINLERLYAYIEAKKQREQELEYNKPEIEQQLVGDLVDLRVEYNGEIGVIKKDEGGKLTFENDNTIIELDGTENAKEYQPQYISYRNGEVLIGDKKYEYVSTNENNNGDVVSVTLTNEKGKNITIRDTDTALAIDRAKSNIYFQSNTNKITEQEELKVVKVELQNEWGGLALGIIESIPDEVLDTFISLESGIVALAPNELQLMTANASQWADDAKKRIEQSKAPKQEKKDAIAMLDKFQKDLNKYYNAIEKQKSKSSNATSKQTSTKQSDKKASTNETKNQVGQPSETQNTPLVKDLSYFENLAKDYQSFDDFYNDVSKMTDISPEVSNEFRDKYKNENNDTAKNALLNLYNAQKNTQQQEQKVETPKVELQPNQTQIADNVIATIDNITLPDGENGFKVTVSDLQGNLIEDKRGDSEFEFSTQEDVDKFINQKQRGYKLEPKKNIKQEDQVSPSPQYEGAVTYTQFGERQEGTIYYEDGVAKIKDKAGKVYNANSPLVKNLKDAEGNAIQLQKGNKRLTPITKQAFDALVKKLQKAFPRFAKVTYDFEAFKKQAEKLGVSISEIQKNIFGSKATILNANFTEFNLYQRAILLNSKGKNSDEILVETGWYLDSDNKWKKLLIPNAEFKDKNIKFDGEYNLSDILDYKSLYQYYPELKNKKIIFNNIDNNLEGYYDGENIIINKSINNEPNEELLNTIVHEIQHIIQRTEGFARGSNYNEATAIGNRLFNSSRSEIDADGELNQAERIIAKTFGENWRESLQRGDIAESKIIDAIYLFSHGEAEARLAEKILNGQIKTVKDFTNELDFYKSIGTIIKFMQTPNGTIYGAKLPDGTIYLNPQFLNANTPIHEFSHLFEQLLPSRFKKGVELLKQTNLGKKIFEQLKQEGNYANLTDEQLWGEALNTHIGNFGENEVNNTKGKLKQLQDWIKDFFAKVGDVLGIKKLSPDTQLRMFTEGVVKDLLGGKPIVAENQVSQSEQVQYSLNENDRKAKQLEIINKTNPAPNSYNTWIRTVNDIKTPEEAFRSAFEDGAMYPDFTLEDMQNVLETGKVTVYSSYPIKEGVFVTPSKMNAEDYAGGRGKRVYSKEIDAKDLAWIDESEGQYAPVNSSEVKFSINSTTPLSVKEQTEVINELVSNGEESAFAKLQETNWYKGLTDNQKQSINPTNIAETVINAVNANKRNLEQKVERRDAKIEKLQDKNKSELEKQKKYYVDKINDIKQKYKEALIELNLKNKTAVEKVRERLDLRKSAINQIKQLLSNKEVGKNVTPSEVMSLVRMSELFFNARDLDKAFDKFIIRFEKVFDKAQYRNKSAEEKFNDKLSKVNPLKADEKASYRREKKSLKERMLIFKNKWFANQGGIFKPFLEHRDRATGLANWEKRVAKNTVEQLTDEANKIGFNTESNWEIFNNALQGDETAIAKLPETIKPYVTMMRSQIDGLSLELIKNDLVTKEQALAIEEHLGKYITRGYSIFEGDTTIEKVGKKFFRMIFKKENSIASRFDSEKWADAVTVFQQNVLNEIALDNSGKYDKYDTDEKKQSFARGEGERRLLEYLSELESEYKKAGSGVGADTSVLERRKEIAEPIRRLLGEYIDPRMSFLLTVSRVSDLAYQRKFLSQVKEIGLGTFLFEEGDPNIPIEGYVKIASDTNGAYSPLNGLYTTKEFKDVFLGEPQKEKYEIEKLWLKLTGLVKVGKTVFSPLTQAVNFSANPGFLINNGLILDVKQISPAFKAFSDTISNGRLDNYIVRELIEENILGQSLIFNEVEKDFGVNMERELIKSIRQTTVAKTAKEIVDIPFRLYKASDDFFKAFAYFSEADRYAKAYFGKKYEELTGDDRMKIRKIASEIVKNTMPNYDRVYRAANLPKEFTRNAVGNYLSFQAESIRTKINSIQYAIADLKNEKTRAVGAKRLAGIMTYNAIYGTVTTLVGKAAGMGMAGLLGFFDDEDEDEKRANFNLTVPEWARSVEKYYRREKDGTITWFAYGNANPYGIWYKTANAYFNGSSNTKGGLISVFDELLTPFLGTEMSLKWVSNTFIAEKNDYGVSLITPKDKLNYSIEKLSPSIVKLIKDNTDNKKENDFELVNILGIKKYNFNPTDQLRYKYNDYAALMSDLGSKKYTLEKQVESGKKKPEEVMDEWKDYDDKQKEYADEFRELAKAYISLGADPTFIQDKATKKFKYEINSISDWWDYITRPE